jgi:hypothetical protein
MAYTSSGSGVTISKVPRIAGDAAIWIMGAKAVEGAE